MNYISLIGEVDHISTAETNGKIYTEIQDIWIRTEKPGQKYSDKDFDIIAVRVPLKEGVNRFGVGDIIGIKGHIEPQELPESDSEMHVVAETVTNFTHENDQIQQPLKKHKKNMGMK